MGQALTHLLVHAIFSTKDRRPFLRSEEIRNEINAYMAGTLKDLDCQPIKIGGIEDHVHLFSSLSKSIAFSDLIGRLKGASSQRLKEKGLHGFGWQNGYGAFSVSESSCSRTSFEQWSSCSARCRICIKASTTAFSNEEGSEVAMKLVTKLAIILFGFGLAGRLSAEHPSVIVDLTEQSAYLLENGRVAFVSPIASGKEDRGTPTGSFKVISKDLNHRSGSFGLITDSYGRIINTNANPGSYVPPGCHYTPAPMPYFMEFCKYVGMHAGYLPGYPASHGCVRMPRDLAAEFFARVQIGTPVKVIGSARIVTRVRKAIPIIQPGNSRYSTAFSNAGRVSRSARNSAGAKRAIPVVQPVLSRYAKTF